MLIGFHVSISQTDVEITPLQSPALTMLVLFIRPYFSLNTVKFRLSEPIILFSTSHLIGSFDFYQIGSRLSLVYAT